MKRIIIICEGQTEQEFCNDVLQKYFINKNIIIQYPLIKKSSGGIVKWKVLKNEIESYLKNEKDIFVSLFIDFYGIKKEYNFPEWEESQRIFTTTNNKYQAINIIQQGMKQNIDGNLNHRFIPYIQLHEFEAILFSDINVFLNNFQKNEFQNYDYLVQTIDKNSNPEMINDGNETAPSKRLNKILIKYNKIIFGSLIAQEIGLEKIREKCIGFNNWIKELEKI